ncbi:DUF2637 domain-containing protein [Streptosporangium soli]|nr:DUF2637 domain-containing protein [Streptosporangium sp. KLBMP 9127]
MIAAVVSFRHMHELCLRHGEDQLAAVLIPLAVDGTIVVASMSILLANRYGSRGGLLAWSLLIIGSLASLGANVAVAEPSIVGRIIAAWPSAALIGSYELLMSQIRRVAVPVSVNVDLAGSERHHVEESIQNLASVDGSVRSRALGVVDLHRAAWQWAQVHRHPDGTLPSGKTIAAQFERSARWGRWIKNAGLAGELG